MRTLIIVIPFLLLIPAASAQGEQEIRQDILERQGNDITFYGHMLGHRRDTPLPMNTQFPVNAEDYSIGNGGGCGAEPPLPDESRDCETWSLNEAWWYTTAGFVQVKDWQEWGGDYSMLHNERGQTKDIYFDTDQVANFTFYMSADFHGWPVAACVALCWNWDPGMFEDWVIESWVWHASLGEWSTDPSARPDMGTIAECYLGGDWEGCEAVQLVAYGKTEPTLMESFDSTIPVVGSETVNEFKADYAWAPSFVASDGVVPFQNDLIIQYKWYQETDGQKYIQGSGPLGIVWNVNGGENYPANVVLPTRNPLDVELVFPRFVHDKLVVLSIINTPWGSYDIDPELTTMTVRNAAGEEVVPDPQHLTTHLDASVAHAGHYKPINATWVWDYQAQGLPPGDYTIEVGATNFQHSFSTSTTASFTLTPQGEGTATAGRGGLASYSQEEFEEFNRGAASGVDGENAGTSDHDGDGESKGSPALPVVTLVAALAAAAVVMRRRRA